MNSKNIRTIAIVVAVVLVLGGGFLLARQVWQSEHRRGPVHSLDTAALPAKMIDFTLPDLNGKPRHLSEWKGKFLIVNFWATWCPPCRHEIPLFIDAQKEYGKRGLQIIGVAVDKTKDVKNFRDFNFIDYPIVTGQEDAMDIMAQYGDRIGSLPYSVLIDPQGRVIGRKVGAYNKQELHALLDSLLPPASS
jgi:thiol-disulfide isomerase/thioredoxin